MKLVAFALLLIAAPAFADTPPSMSGMPGMAAPAPAAATTPPSPPKETVIVGPTGKTLVITAAVLADLDRDQATMINHSVPHTYEGVLLTELLRLVDAPTGARIHATIWWSPAATASARCSPSPRPIAASRSAR
jgi:hypothetical protein